MTPEQYRRLKAFINRLRKLGWRADELEITLDNGGQVGGLLSSIATELELQLDRPVPRMSMEEYFKSIQRVPDGWAKANNEIENGDRENEQNQGGNADKQSDF